MSLTVGAHSISQKLAKPLAPFEVPVVFCYCHKLKRIAVSVITGANKDKIPTELQSVLEKVQRIISSYCGGGSQSVQAVAG